MMILGIFMIWFGGVFLGWFLRSYCDFLLKAERERGVPSYGVHIVGTIPLRDLRGPKR